MVAGYWCIAYHTHMYNVYVIKQYSDANIYFIDKYLFYLVNILERFRLGVTFTANVNHVTKFPLTCALLLISSAPKLVASR